MVTRQRSQKEKELQEKQADEKKKSLKREEILLEIMTRQQAVKAEKKALRRRRSSLRNTDETSENEDTGKSPKHRYFIATKFILVLYLKPLSELMDNVEYTPWNISTKGQSRFENEFEHIKWLGEGAFGDVIKVRNKLDDGFYAIKRIKLNPKNTHLNKKITREVKLLSRLNHENVVRYYNSWIESAVEESRTSIDLEESGKSPNLQNMLVGMLPRREPSLEWKTKPNESSEESSEDEWWITFKSASHDCDEVDGASLHSYSETFEEDSDLSNDLQYMYIQMELCEKSTLRRAIDENLNTDIQRVWRLFREIVEGLCHIHQQGIIHRDLKPVNIFLDNDDHVKIGDFGLATTSILHKESYFETSLDKVDCNNTLSQPSQTGDISQTGLIGTALYVAPELKSKIAKVPYNEKVDIFSLGVIFFEMCHPALKTGMERYKILTDLRQNEPVFPPDFPYDNSSSQHILIKWMLNHDSKKRPSSLQLLQSENIPPPELEEAEVKEMVRRTISNPQSKDYKHLIASCFKQITSPVVDATYNHSSGRSGWFLVFFESVTEKLKKVFWRHGALSLHPPLLTPLVDPIEMSVCLMTQWGGIVYATYDLRTPFARYLAHNPNLTRMKRYAIDKVYREKRVYGLHPKEMFECSFDIVTPTQGRLFFFFF
ncbi:hypothetical protein AAG570_012642 [Ranatra chinensis]|uniref:Protein kinase domain-containing protein n=1 Tax=Ranatra chinensis TaxID=642074 RepID=A0ABD0Z0P4_9HEMI